MHRILPALAATLFGFALTSAMAAGPAWTFDVRLASERADFEVSACSDVAQHEVRFRSGRRQALRHLVTYRRSSETEIERGDGFLRAREWKAGECLLTRIDVRAAARESARGAVQRDDVLLLDPRLWLWRPDRHASDSTIGFELPAGWQASVPWTPLRGPSRRHRLGETAADWPSLTAFGRFREQTVRRPGGVLRVALLPPWRDADLVRIEPVADALLKVYGRLPRRDAQVLVVPLPGRSDAAPWGQVTRGGSSAVQLFVGAEARPDALIQDWTATHEFSHLLHPYLGSAGRWLGEGLASYYQNVLRARVGALSPDDAWSRLEAGFGRGRRSASSAGMTLEAAARRMHALRSQMRVYWSGAAFWLEADLALRERGSSLDAVLERHAACCLARAARLAPADYMRELDRIAGDDVFSARYARFAAARSFPQVAEPSGEERHAILGRRAAPP